MRKNLKNARIVAGKTQAQVATAIGISIRMYQHIEFGTREGKCYIWDKLEDFFLNKYPQRNLRINET